DGPMISLMLLSHLILTPSLTPSSASNARSRHVRPIAVINYQSFVGTEPAGRARNIHGRIAASLDRDAAAEARRLASIDAAKKGQSVEHFCRILRGDIDMAADMSAACDKHSIEAVAITLGEGILAFVIEDNPHAQFFDPPDVVHQVGA